MDEHIDAEMIAAYVEGRLEIESRERIEAHIDRCATCRGEVSAMATADTIGRYQLVRRLGQGGMGMVWEAIDPELDRRVAIKVMHQTPGDSADIFQGQLKREAQVLARLAHPNVVVVHDVGLAGGELYIVMQLVEGTTLDRYLAQNAPSVPEIIALFVQAARGLAAAHRAGIVHRDFKPTNVLVAGDGTVRVSDFGLARVARDASQVSGDIAVSIAAGGLVGTPAYMAPEQFENGQITPATDQFAFCVALWEALYRQRPFQGDSIETLRDAVVRGRRTEADDGRRLPRGVRAALVRGLSTDPRDRFPSLDALVTALEPRRRWWWRGAALAAAGAAVAAIAVGMMTSHRDPCAGIEQPADAVWNPAQRAVVAASIGRDGDAIVRVIDDRITRWRSARRDACEATHVRNDQTQALLDRRYLCLDRSLVGMRTAIAILANQPDVQARARARDLARSAIDPDECRAETVAANAPVSTDARHEALFAQVAQLRAQRLAGQHAEVLARRPAITAELAKISAPELEARAYHELARSGNFATDDATSTELHQRSAEAALRAGLDELAVEEWCQVAAHVAQSDMAGARRLVAMAQAFATRSGSPHEEMMVESTLGELAWMGGDYAGAVAHEQRAIGIAERRGDRVQVSDLYALLAHAQELAHDIPAAIASWRHSIELFERERGADNPDVLWQLHFLASALDAHGDTAAARPLWDRAMTGLTKTAGAESPLVLRAMIDHVLAGVTYDSLSPEDTLALAERATTVGEKILPARDPDRGRMLELLSSAQRRMHRDRDAGATLKRAIAFYEAGDAPLPLVLCLLSYGELLSSTDRCDDAVPVLRRAAEVAAKTQDARPGAVSEGLEGACLGTLGHHDEAVAKLKHSIETLARLGEIQTSCEMQFELATEYFQSGQKSAGLELARSVAARLEAMPPPADQLRASILAWLKNPS